MKNKKGNVAVIAIIVVIVAITAGVIGYLLATKTHAPVTQPVVNQPVTKPAATTQTTTLPTQPKENNISNNTTNGNSNNVDACAGIKQITDNRDNKNPIYKTVSIGTQCWLSRNLNVGKMIKGVNDQKNNNLIEKYCAINDEKNCDKYGGFYQWDEAMRYSRTEKSQGICPDDWHVPSDDEWLALEKFLTNDGETCEKDGDSIYRCKGAGTKLRLNGPNDFNLVFGGNRGISRNYGGHTVYGPSDIGIEVSALLWTSTEYYASGAWLRELNADHPDTMGSSIENNGIDLVFRFSLLKGAGLSVRCIKN